ncbi:hypothetical protein PYCC9005_002607 [Savitreella phatthalungensis]
MVLSASPRGQETKAHRQPDTTSSDIASHMHEMPASSDRFGGNRGLSSRVFAIESNYDVNDVSLKLDDLDLQHLKEELDRDVESGISQNSVLPVSPLQTPAAAGRSRASTSSQQTPPLQIFDYQAVHGLQLATPPSEHISDQNVVKLSGSRHSLAEAAGRRHSIVHNVTHTANAASSDHQNHNLRRASYQEFNAGDHSLPVFQPVAQSQMSRQLLQVNTTSDAFPILVRRDADPGETVTAPHSFNRGRAELPIGVDYTHGHNMPINGRLQDGRPRQMYAGQASSRPLQQGEYSRYFASVNNQASGAFMRSHEQDVLGTRFAGASARPSSLHSGLLNSHLGFSIVHDVHLEGKDDYSRGSVPLYQHYYRQSGPETAIRPGDVPLESLRGQLYNFCRDQHGCRFLQKRLDDGDEATTAMIFDEILEHTPTLMIDPFGNYLCQKLFEHCTEMQQTRMLEVVGPNLIAISLDMHGTRAVQKMIEQFSTAEHVQLLTSALAKDPVLLIRDLNGNHVIQKCLNRLSSTQAQFIYDAVSNNCVAIATHRHGCCVLQRCIDHASKQQRDQVIRRVIADARQLVQDPFGNYVVQYVLDLGDVILVDELIKHLCGGLSAFSMQKFSSNVVEKCLRVARSETRARMIAELLPRQRLDRLLRDSYGNYVVQTALDHANSDQRRELVDAIRPLLPSIKSTPYGRRLQSRIGVDTGTPAAQQHDDMTRSRVSFGLAIPSPTMARVDQNISHPHLSQHQSQHQQAQLQHQQQTAGARAGRNRSGRGGAKTAVQ